MKRRSPAPQRCVNRELMRRIGDGRASAFYERGWQTAAASLATSCATRLSAQRARAARSADRRREGHFQGALDGVRARRAAPDSDPRRGVVTSASHAGLPADGLPLLPGRPSRTRTGHATRGLAVMAGARFAAVDTNDVPVDWLARRGRRRAAVHVGGDVLGQRLSQGDSTAHRRAASHARARATRRCWRARGPAGTIGALDLCSRGPRRGAQVTTSAFQGHQRRAADGAGGGLSRALDLHRVRPLLAPIPARPPRRVVEFLPDQRRLTSSRSSRSSRLPWSEAVGRAVCVHGNPDVVVRGIDDRAAGVPSAPSTSTTPLSPLCCRSCSWARWRCAVGHARAAPFRRPPRRRDFGIRLRAGATRTGVGAARRGDWDFTVQPRCSKAVQVRPLDRNSSRASIAADQHQYRTP